MINFPQKQLKSFSIIICKLMLYLFYFIFDIEVHRVFKIISIESNPFSNFISVNIRKLYCIVLILVIINRYLLLNKTQLITDLPLSTLLLSILQKAYYYLIIKSLTLFFIKCSRISLRISFDNHQKISQFPLG